MIINLSTSYEVERLRGPTVIATPMTLYGDTKERRIPLNLKNKGGTFWRTNYLFVIWCEQYESPEPGECCDQATHSNGDFHNNLLG